MGEKKIHVFEGTMRFCGRTEPHFPHAYESYKTVIGWLSRFCPGVPGPGVEYRIVGYLQGDPRMPSVLRWVEGNEFVEPDRMYLGEKQTPEIHDEIVKDVLVQIRVRELDERLLRIIRERKRGSSGAE